MDKVAAQRRSGLLSALGPGIMYAGAAIGVSHLVQSTRAGASYGFALLWAVVLIHLLKYPFFEFAHRYTAATGENLLVGYRRIGKWAIRSYLLVALCLSIPSAAVLTIVTAGMASQLFTDALSPLLWSVVLLVVCITLLAIGGYPLLERVMKVMMALLVICTIVAVVAAVQRGGTASANFDPPDVWNPVGIVFLVALMGWMPTPVDASAFPSVWMQERAKQTGYSPSIREALFDFNLGYLASLIMAVMFLALGALVMFGSKEPFAAGANGFAAQFVAMYVDSLGSWSRPLIVAAAFLTMFSTMITVLDAYPRVLSAGFRVAWPEMGSRGSLVYWGIIGLMALGTLLIIAFLTDQMGTLVDFATTVAFLSAPLFGYLNVRVLSNGGLPQSAAPPLWLMVLSWIGLVFLLCFSAVFLYVRLTLST